MHESRFGNGRRTGALATLCLTASILCGASVGAAESRPLPAIAALQAHASMPDPLVMFDGGQRIKTPADWFAKRRPELRRLFEHYMYGYFPAASAGVQAKAQRTDRGCLGGKATLKLVAIQYGPPGAPPIDLLLVVPNRRSGPAPVFAGLNFCGNHQALADPSIPPPQAWSPDRCPGCEGGKATDKGRGKQADAWSIEQAVDRGYAVATFYTGDIKPDRPVDSEGIHQHYRQPSQGKPGKHDWGTIAAWAFGLQRVVDYLLTDSDIDGKRIAVVGHSRLGKTALLAGAFDERIALIVVNQAGMGGSAPSRGKTGESVKAINDRFPHWFNGAYKEFNTRPERLPLDQNCLVALCAPRPVLFNNAVEDTWANPDGQFEVLKAADPVYRLLGVNGLAATQRPPVDQLLDSRLGYRIRPGKHSITGPDWKVFLDYADRHLGKPGSP